MVEKYTVEKQKNVSAFTFYKYVAKRYISHDGKTFVPVEEYMARTKDMAINKMNKWKRGCRNENA